MAKRSGVGAVYVDGEQLSRLNKLCRSMASGGGKTIATLQKSLNISRRTIFRDLNTLGDMGIAVELTATGYKVKKTAAACKKQLADIQTNALNKLLTAALK